MRAPKLMVNDVLIFESAAFSIEPPLSERGLRYDLPLGEDIAAYLKRAVQEGAWTRCCTFPAALVPHHVPRAAV